MSGQGTMPGSAEGSPSAVVIRADEAEVLAGPTIQIRLLADSSATSGALSTQRVTMATGSNGAAPHLHKASSELFYVLDGSVDVLIGDQVATGRQGDLVVVPPGLAHAFGASAGHAADLLIVITPGVERFEYFRHLGRIAAGQVPPESLLEVQDRYDTHFLASEAWTEARTG